MHIPKSDEGRIGITLNVARRLRKKYPDIALYGLITGPFTLALHLCGTDIFMKMFTDEQGVHDIMAFCQKVCEAMSSYYIEAGCDVVALVDPMCSQISPEQFNQFVAEYCKGVFARIKELGALSSFFVCGQAQHNIEAMCACRPNCISIDENIALDFVKEKCLANDVAYGGNLQLTQVLLMGDVQDSQTNVVSCLDIARGEDKKFKGFVLSPGCDLAYDTPVENLEACAKLNKDEYQQDVVRIRGPKKMDVEPLDLGTYLLPDKVRVDVVTLDASGCAACQYMWEAALRGSEKFKDIILIKEHSIKTQDGLEFMYASGVKDIPSIMIDGVVRFASLIPPVEEISAAIEQAYNNKKNI